MTLLVHITVPRVTKCHQVGLETDQAVGYETLCLHNGHSGDTAIGIDLDMIVTRALPY